MATAAKKLSKLERPPRGGQATIVEAIRQGLWEEMERDPTVFLIGEDVGVYGGAFKVTEGLLDHFGEERVLDTPIAEASIVGLATERPPSRSTRATPGTLSVPRPIFFRSPRRGEPNGGLPRLRGLPPT